MSVASHNVGDLIVGIDTFTENNEVKCGIALGLIVDKFAVDRAACVSDCQVAYQVLWAKHGGRIERECDCSLMSYEELSSLQKYSRMI